MTFCQGCGGTYLLEQHTSAKHIWSRCSTCGKMNVTRVQEPRGSYIPAGHTKLIEGLVEV